MRGAPLCFEDKGREPSQLFTGTPELGDRRGERLGIAELEVRAGEDAQTLCGCPGRAPTRGPAQCDELLAERAPLGGLCRGLQTDRSREERLSQCRCIPCVARQLDCSISECTTVPALELVGGVLERLDRHQANPKGTIVVAENPLRLVEQCGDLFRIQGRRHWLGERGDGPSELFR